MSPEGALDYRDDAAGPVATLKACPISPHSVTAEAIVSGRAGKAVVTSDNDGLDMRPGYKNEYALLCAISCGGPAPLTPQTSIDALLQHQDRLHAAVGGFVREYNGRVAGGDIEDCVVFFPVQKGNQLDVVSDILLGVGKLLASIEEDRARLRGRIPHRVACAGLSIGDCVVRETGIAGRMEIWGDAVSQCLESVSEACRGGGYVMLHESVMRLIEGANQR